MILAGQGVCVNTSFQALAFPRGRDVPIRIRPDERAAGPRGRSLIAWAAVIALLPSSSPAAYAQDPYRVSGAQSLLLDASVRASGMGRASNAVFWGDCPNYWSNPALLASEKGIKYGWGRTQLFPELAEDVFFTTKRLTVGWWGIGLLAAGRPLKSLGGTRLDYGVSIATDVDGNELARFTSYEETRSLGAAVSLLELAGHALTSTGVRAPPLSRFGDVSIGWTEKKTHVFLAATGLTPTGFQVSGDVTTHDSGILVRATPYNAIDYPGLLPAVDRVLRARVDVSYGGSTQSFNDPRIGYAPSGSSPVARVQRKGWAAHVALSFSSRAEEALRSRRLGWLPAWVSPLLSWGKAWDREVPMVLDPASGHVPGKRAEKSGWEMTIANIYSIRKGQIDDPAAFVEGTTSGWSLGLHVKNLAGLCYDRATIPQAGFLKPAHRKALTLYVNPITVLAKARGRAAG